MHLSVSVVLYDMENAFEFNPYKILEAKVTCLLCFKIFKGFLFYIYLVQVTCPKWLSCPYMVKSFRNLLLQNL